MVLSLSFILVSLSDAALYYVTKDGLDCPLNSTCKTLSFYSRVPGDYFVNDTVFHFLKGTHILDHSIQVSGVTNITFLGVLETRQGSHETVSEPLSVITCQNGSGNIVFNQQSSSVHLSYLTICNCSRYYFDAVSPAALVFHESYDINLSHLAILNCSGYGLLVANGYGTNIESSTFANNWINSYIVYSPPELCFNNLNKYTLNIVSSNFTNSRYIPSLSTGYGLLVIIRTQLTYQVVTQLDDVTALSNALTNIAFVIFDGHPHSLVITNTISSFAGIFGLLVYTQDILLETECTSFSPTNDFIDANITVSDSQFTNNFLGIGTLFDIFLPYVGTSSLQFEIIRCIVSWNKGTGIHWDRNLDKINSLTLKIQDSVIQYNSYFDEVSAIFVYRTTTYLENNLISNNYQAGLVVLDSEVIVSGTNNVFRNNSGFDGGAVGLLHSDLLIAQDSSIAFIDNVALRKGGALYIDRLCGLQILNDESNNTLNNVTLTFINNSALIGGDIYGLTSPLNCLINVGNIHNVVHLNMFELQSSTDSVGVCPCDEDDSLIACFEDTHNNYRLISRDMSLYPGKVIEVPIVVVGFGGENTYALTDGIIDLDVDGKEVSNIPYNGTYCYKLTYAVTQSSSETNYTEILIRSDPSYLNFVSVSTQPGIRIQVTFLPCPEGFKLLDGKCECTDILRNTEANINCNITSEEISVTREGPEWYGKWTEDNCYVIDTTCGYNYCKDEMVTFDLMNGTDEQCHFDRHGILCSQCPDGQSLQLGSNKCGSCHNFSLSLLIVFALAGIGLVGLIIALNLTVSVGTINGLIFYANIVKMYEYIFFPRDSIPFVSQFISWLNLDLGITMCFYDGMDTYSKSWLQFVFPFYIWLLILLIIALSKLSARLSQLLGSHVMPVLATLFLLSYIKLMRSIVFVLGAQKVTIACDDGGMEDQIRWLADPTMRYLSFKHAVIFTFAVTLLVIFVIPYTVALLFSPLLQGYLSKFRYCSFWNNLKPVFDAYNAPYKDNLRFWPGFLLLIRIPILVAASVANSFNTDKNALLSVALISIVIALTTSNIVGGVYRIWYLNVLETGFLLNAAVLTVAATNDVNSNTYKAILIISVLVSFLAFVGIIVFHVYLKLSKGGYKGTELKMQTLADKFKRQKGATTNRVYRDSLEWYTDSTTKRKDSNDSTLSMNLLRRESLLFDEHANDYVINTDSTIR